MSKKRCKNCNTKLKLISFECPCSNEKKIYCSKCRLPENHDCKFDFTCLENKESLKESLVKVEYEKVIRI